jgi:diaminopimelate dehydrogenase
MSITVAVHGLGNIGRHVVDCLSVAPDMVFLGVIRRAASLGKNAADLKGFPDFASIENLAAKQGKPDVVIICGPSRSVPEDASAYLSKGYRTVDSFDIHDELPSLVKKTRRRGKKP